jgi:hypothetical protein
MAQRSESKELRGVRFCKNQFFDFPLCDQLLLRQQKSIAPLDFVRRTNSSLQVSRHKYLLPVQNEISAPLKTRAH